MEIRKATEIQGSVQPTQQQMEAINALAKAQLTAEQVYAFSLRLCDDQIDRDYERFDSAALPVLAKLFVGKAGVVDHNWSAKNQLARIFATEVVQDGGVNYLKAWAYIRRGGNGDEWIADIEAGIKKEVSIGCAVASSICSICGSEYGSCGHRKGEQYDGQVCCVILRDPVDAYEFSFVAVPAQREAGVLKGLGQGQPRLKELAWEYGAQEEYIKLCKLAELGREYETAMQQEVVRLCLMLELGLEEERLRSVAKSLGPDDLQALRSALQQRVAQCYPMQMQLSGGNTMDSMESEYMI